jgi:hypothetical protein
MNTLVKKILQVTSLLVFALNFIFSSSIVHATTWAIEGSNSFTGTVSVAMPITDLQISGGATTSVPVKLRVTSGSLQMSVTTGLTFTGGTSGATLQFTGTRDAVNTALATLTYTRGSTGSDTLEVSLVEPGEVFFEGTGNLYEYVSYTASWNNAKTHAEGRTKYGATGYLVTVTSQEENDFVAARLLNAGWMGASDSAVENAWRWVTGPENGQQFWSGLSGGSTVGGMYANWGTGEPNNSGEEDCAQFLTGGSGKWNDLPCSSTTLPGYVVEYGEDGTEPLVVAKNISITTSSAPSVSVLTPTDNSTNVATSSNLTIQFSQTVNAGIGTISIYKVSDNSLVETLQATSSAVTGGGTNTIVINPSSDFQEDTGYYVLVGSTAFKNGSDVHYSGITASTTWNFTVGDFTAPTISNIVASTTSSTTVDISWDTNELTNSRVHFGPSSSYGSSTDLSDTSPRVLTRTKSLSNLIACTKYHYQVVSADGYNNTATSTGDTFTAPGCNGGVSTQSATSSLVSSASNATTTLSEGRSTIIVETPANFTATSSNIAIQILSLPSTGVLADIGKPSTSLNHVSNIVFDIKAIIDSSTVLDSFDIPVTITYEYSDEDMSGIDEDTLWLHHYKNGSWSALDDCSVNTSANTITCTAPHFSIFALFGSSVQSGITVSTSGTRTAISSTQFGCRDIKAVNYNAFVSHKQEYCVYGSNSSVSTSTTTFDSTGSKSSGFPIAGKFIFNKNLQIGSRHSDVKELQKFLNSLGFTVSAFGAGSVGKETDVFGSATRSAVIKYQQANNIKPAIGYFGPVTRRSIKN